VATACADEQVRLRFSRAASAPDRLLIHAEKLVGGGFVPMGDAELSCAPAAHAWVFDVRSLGVPVRWSYGLEGARLSATLAPLPSGPVIRRLKAERTPGPRG
jgi:hypothetical protein